MPKLRVNAMQLTTYLERSCQFGIKATPPISPNASLYRINTTQVKKYSDLKSAGFSILKG